MKKCLFGDPIFFEGQYQKDVIYDLYIQSFTCSFEIKKDKIPTIQIKNSLCFGANEYIESTNGEEVLLTLTNVDLKLFLDHYNVYDLTYLDGWKFKSINGLFTDYVNKWTEKKIQSKREGNKGMYTISKLMLNSLYGKFALNPKIQSKKPFLSDDDIVKYSDNEEEIRDGLYLPVGTFITAYARNKTIRTSQAIKDYSIQKYGKDMYLYSDTDSIHTLLPIEECKKFCDIDDYKLYFWKHESNFSKAKFIRQKTYVEIIDDELKITCAGLPQRCYKHVTFENFKIGFTCNDKLKFTHVKRTV